MPKILFAVQATGNGHLSRAREIIPHLQQHGEVDVLVSGTQADVQLPYMIKYKKNGLSYAFGKHGGISGIDSIRQLKPIRLLRDIFTFPVHTYDLIINDFEPLTAWACRLQKKSCIGLSHQAAFLSPATPRPLKINAFAEWILHKYAPTSHYHGFHFNAYDAFIHTPVIRREIRSLNPSAKGHITVYLPAHADDLLISHFVKFKHIRWEIFSKHSLKSYNIGSIEIKPVNNDLFIQSLEKCEGVITAGGFESVAEAMFLEKKVMVIPMYNQYEQQCNAVAAGIMGNTVVNKLDTRFHAELENWLNDGKPVQVHYPDQTNRIIEQIMKQHLHNNLHPSADDSIYSRRIEQG
ncbi:MAG: glycosyltransferase family protein [Bacteroidia bacterium]|jgi:uncharacterized protein (TIGR00661 family)